MLTGTRVLQSFACRLTVKGTQVGGYPSTSVVVQRGFAERSKYCVVCAHLAKVVYARREHIAGEWNGVGVGERERKRTYDI